MLATTIFKIMIVVKTTHCLVEFEEVNINCETRVSSEKLQSYCYLNETTMISADNVELLDNKIFDVNAIIFDYNKKIEFLPINVYKSFPNLKTYYASQASIKNITSSNFKRLLKLKLLDLSRNQIEIIPEDCFQGLNQLQKICLGKKHSEGLKYEFLKLWKLLHTEGNRIKEVDGIVFFNLPQLVIVDLSSNNCINWLFKVLKDSSEMRRRISSHCGSANATKKQISCNDSPIHCNGNWPRLIFSENLNCCEVEYGTYIDSPDYTFAKNQTYLAIEKLAIEFQRNIDFLPILVHEQFPILKTYTVTNTPIRRISKRNFEKLHALEELILENNLIEMIKKDTFEDLVNLKRIHISMKRLL